MATIARLFFPKVCVSAMPKLERLPEPYIQQAYGVYLLQSQHRLVRSLKRLYEPSVHGHKAWHSSFILMDYLLHRPFRRGWSASAPGICSPAGTASARCPDSRARCVARGPAALCARGPDE